MHTQPSPLTCPLGPTLPALSAGTCFELRFESLFHPGRALAFPCDARGCVELDGLSDPARRNYFYARTVVGREFSNPSVVPGQHSH